MSSGSEDVLECKLLRGALAFAAQGTLVVLVVGSLLYKRHQERPQRPIKIWGYDVGKQGVSSAVNHFWNIGISVIASNFLDVGKTSECAWYFVVYIIDNTLGVALAILMHNFFLSMARNCVARSRSMSQGNSGDLSQTMCNSSFGFNPDAQSRSPARNMDDCSGKSQLRALCTIIVACGDYGNPPKFTWWLVQSTEWVVAVIIARSLSGAFDIVFKDLGLVQIARAVDKRAADHPKWLLFFVMVFFPFILNIVQAWIKDAILKAAKKVNIATHSSKPSVSNGHEDHLLLGDV